MPIIGIDHTAIVVADTSVSLHFHHDVLGLRITGVSEVLANQHAGVYEQKTW